VRTVTGTYGHIPVPTYCRGDVEPSSAAPVHQPRRLSGPRGSQARAETRVSRFSAGHHASGRTRCRPPVRRVVGSVLEATNSSKAQRPCSINRNAARSERRTAVDRTICSPLLSSGSQVRVLPGASSEAASEAQCLPWQQRTDMSRMVLWKRCGSTHHAGGGLANPSGAVRASLCVPCPNSQAVAAPLLARAIHAVAARAPLALADGSGVEGSRVICSSQAIRTGPRTSAVCRVKRKRGTTSSRTRTSPSPDRRRNTLCGGRQRRVPLAHLTGMAECRPGELQREGMRIGALADVLPIEHILAELPVPTRRSGA
jgi:hypothetical protein